MNTNSITEHYEHLSDAELTRLAWNVALIDAVEYTDGLNVGPARPEVRDNLDPVCPHCGSDAVSMWADDGEDETADRMDCGFCGWNVDEEPLPCEPAPSLQLATDDADLRYMVCLDGGPPPMADEILTRNDELTEAQALAFAKRLRRAYPFDLVTVVIEPRVAEYVVEWDGGWALASSLTHGHEVAAAHKIPRDEYRIVANEPDGATVYEGGA